MNYIRKMRTHGILGSVRQIANIVRCSKPVVEVLYKHAPRYTNPGPDDLVRIERGLDAAGVNVVDFEPSAVSFNQFRLEGWFPDSLYGGPDGRVRDEKLLEHWLSLKILDIDQYDDSDIYLDVAASRSPWAKILRERYFC